MDLQTILLSERHKILKEYRLYDSIYIIPKKIQTNSWSEADQYLLVDKSEGEKGRVGGNKMEHEESFGCDMLACLWQWVL